MKKIWIFFLIGIFVFSGCTTKENENIQKLSKDRETVDAVIMGNYYTLPCSLKEFLDNGWEEMKEDGVSLIDTVELEPNTIIRIAFKNKQRSLEDVDAQIHLTFINDTTKTIKINDQTNVIGLDVSNYHLASKDFVTKKGATLNIKRGELNKIFEGTPSFEADEYSSDLKNSKNVGIISFLFKDNDSDNNKNAIVSNIILNSGQNYNYKTYRSPAEIEKDVENYKKETEKNSAKYLSENYDGLIAELKNGGSSDLFIDGKVVEAVTIVDEDLDYLKELGYLIKDKKGKEYVLEYSSNDSFVLKVGDTIQVWGKSNQVVKIKNKSDIDLPYITPLIININGKEKLNYYRDGY